ncbi:hypothetical protein BU24DRAFT_471866 [Aaosphaeria arxii CBS 175.79]|uniref:protein-ribulosamine 3-kinase n=1 Tax=Aaosphaeria arxii CBS 175.79 TaxID=1450172 RepID=A0A6A5XD53_9PLEO|nr:uncharacterized protein BU24DRAFT_471866 [Aaosphaeria arxii CBS 175.79]KAF2010803.1 hypothetical protein BU24DRAFT_471866 [Aaosphaeria arxii CBS 175.79]
MTMLSGEFESSQIIYGLMNDFLPTPIAFGKFKAPGPPTYFYLCEFVNMDVTVAPDPAEFTKRLAQLHRISRSPTGKFGFDVQTYDGQVTHIVEWQDKWETFFTNMLMNIYEKDLATNGRWVEMERATKQIVHVVIPRLLGALQAGDRKLEPAIIHGDLWEGNMGINVQNGKSILFDAGSYYGHNEIELGIWRCQFSSVFRSKEYLEHYLSNYREQSPLRSSITETDFTA